MVLLGLYWSLALSSNVERFVYYTGNESVLHLSHMGTYCPAYSTHRQYCNVVPGVV